MSQFKKIACGLICLLALLAGHAQTTLTPGDIAIIGHDNDDADQVVFVNLVDLSVGTTIKFTDNGWTGTAFSTTEGTFTWTAAIAYPKGSVLTLNTTGMALSTSGDQVFAYQGTSTAPALIYGFSTTPWLTSGAVGSTTSYLPAALTNGSTAFAYAVEKDDGYYNLLASNGDKAAQLSQIANISNWVTSDTRFASWPTWAFNVTSLAPEPTAQPTALTFSAVTTYGFRVAYTAPASVPAGYIVIRRQGFPPSSAPVDGTPYMVGDKVGDAKVAYVGNANGFLQEGVIAATGYYYKVFAYNGSGNLINYRQTSPLSGFVTTPATGMGSYYGTISPTVSTFVTDLENRIRSPYTRVVYDQYDETMMTHFAFRDTTGNQRVATCVYSGEVYRYAPPFTWYSASPFSREHTFCHSWMPTYPLTSGEEYSDQMHLFPVDQTGTNVPRSNHPLGVVTTVVSTFFDSKYGRDANGFLVFEPRDAHKGDAARALLYMCLRYDQVGGNDWTINHLNTVTLPGLNEGSLDLNLMRQWSQMDPPDNYEIARNDYIQSIQGNRNPFVDHPNWVGYIDFNTMSWLSVPLRQSGELPLSVSVWPNPAADVGYLSVVAPQDMDGEWMLVDELGRIVQQHPVGLLAGVNEIDVQPAQYAAGMYLAIVRSNGAEATTRVVIRHP